MKNLNKSQKIILTVWVVLVALLFVATLTPVSTNYGDAWIEPDFGQFIIGSIIISIPSFIIFRVWGK